jgi:hypothetical protein
VWVGNGKTSNYAKVWRRQCHVVGAQPTVKAHPPLSCHVKGRLAGRSVKLSVHAVSFPAWTASRCNCSSFLRRELVHSAPLPHPCKQSVWNKLAHCNPLSTEFDIGTLLEPYLTTVTHLGLGGPTHKTAPLYECHINQYWSCGQRKHEL